jgi:hypothetical protein
MSLLLKEASNMLLIRNKVEYYLSSLAEDGNAKAKCKRQIQ